MKKILIILLTTLTWGCNPAEYYKARILEDNTTVWVVTHVSYTAGDSVWIKPKDQEWWAIDTGAYAMKAVIVVN